MKSLLKNNLVLLIYGVCIIILDQASKFSVLAFMNPRQVLNIFPGFNLTLTFNFGTSFNILSPRTELEYDLIIVLTVILIAALVIIFFKLKNLKEKVCLVMIIAGAVGNLIDRFIHGAVVDFLDLYYGSHHWPAFNLADSFISIGCSILILMSLFSKEKPTKKT